MLTTIILSLSYLLGTIPSAIFVARIFKLQDPLKSGSGNPGATNIMRLGGKEPAVITFLMDMSKGMLVLLLARIFLPKDLWSMAFFTAVLGHMFPIWSRFKGGKGVATFLGCTLGLSPHFAMYFISTWASVFFFYRISAVSGISACLVTSALLVNANSTTGVIWYLLVLSLILYKHKINFSKYV